MSSSRSQSRLTLANGIVVERLPVGFAAGHWWATFVYSLPDWRPGDPFLDHRTARSCAQVHDPDGRLEPVRGSGGGSENEHTETWAYVDHGATRVEVRYTDDGVEVGTESLPLDPADRDGCFAVRLEDGSLIERLPIGHAHGAWRLRWVRSDVPRHELDIETDDDGFELAMAHERFLRLSTPDGPLERLSASASGGPVQPFAVQVPDSVTDLRIDYVLGDEMAGAEVLELPAPTDRA